MLDDKAHSREISFAEKMGLFVDNVRVWFFRTWRYIVLMVKGVYLVTERRKLYEKLGSIVYEKRALLTLKDNESSSLLHQLERINKKIEIEEMLIRSLQSGTRWHRKHKTVNEEGMKS